MFFSVPIILEETYGINRLDEPVSIGIPFSKGRLTNINKLYLSGKTGRLPLQLLELAKWPDGSLKWVLVDFQVNLNANQKDEIFLHVHDETDTSSPYNNTEHKIITKETETGIQVDTGIAAFFINKRKFKPFDRIVLDGVDILDDLGSKFLLTDKSRIEHAPVIEKIFFEIKGSLKTVLKVEGQYLDISGNAFLVFSSRITFWRNSKTVKIEFTVKNPEAAIHSDGLWDLGDPKSYLFDDLSFLIVLSQSTDKPKKVFWKTEPASQFHESTTNNIKIYQDSSGGENWKSSNHINRNKVIFKHFKGFRVYSDNEIIENGNRANPVMGISYGGKYIAGCIKDFWQNFPKAIEINENKLSIKLFPCIMEDLFELQGGEQKTHTFFLDFGLQNTFRPSLLEWAQFPLLPYLTPDYYAESKVFPYLSTKSNEANKELIHLVNSAIEGNNTFFDRRETIDEYGWRNFGDFYADHEAVGHQGTKPLVSHYNNQYDGIFGTIIQFARTGYKKWFTLTEQLAQHVKDIDIYHTDKDRPEYNHGMFWHTEHYIDAGTATHRCFSKEHLHKKNPSNYGGGPSLSHIYTTGLLYHYYLTGDLSSREAVIELASFIINNIENERTISAILIHQLKKIKSLKNYQNLVQLNKVYGLDGPGRASGNALNTLLNAFVLTENKKYLNQSEELIRNIISPDDNIEKRDLLDTENRWMYNVFLEALGKYLDIKTEYEQFDYMRKYAYDCLIHYAKWMLDNEYPYLSKPEKLEFPNETWAVQDIRKCNVMLYAAKYCYEPSMKEIFVIKADFFFNEAKKYLLLYNTKNLTRPMVLLMSNINMYCYFKQTRTLSNYILPENIKKKKPLFKKLILILNFINNLSLKREIEYIKWRLK